MGEQITITGVGWLQQIRSDFNRRGPNAYEYVFHVQVPAKIVADHDFERVEGDVTIVITPSLRPAAALQRENDALKRDRDQLKKELDAIRDRLQKNPI